MGLKGRNSFASTAIACSVLLPLSLARSPLRILSSLPMPPALLGAHDNRFCSLSWYDRQLVENARFESKQGGGAKAGDGGGGDIAGCQSSEAAGADKAEVGAGSVGSGGQYPAMRLYGSDGGFGIGSASRARSGDASVMATLKARGTKSSSFA